MTSSTEQGSSRLDELKARLEIAGELNAEMDAELGAELDQEKAGDEKPVLKLESSQEAPRQPRVSEPVAQEGSKKVAIIGSAGGWELAPYKDPSWSIWSLSRMYHSIPRWDVWFELHPWDRLCERRDGKTPELEQQRLRAEYQQWLQQDHGRPIFMQQNYPQVPGAVKYPLDRMLETFPQRYYTNSVSYMLALAIVQGAEEIAIYGVDMATEEEYTLQRPGVEYWVGLAQGAGIDVHIPPLSDLCKSRTLYGFMDDELADKLTYKLDLAMRQQEEAKEMKRQSDLALANGAGAKQILEWLLRNY